MPVPRTFFATIGGPAFAGQGAAAPKTRQKITKTA